MTQEFRSLKKGRGSDTTGQLVHCPAAAVGGGRRPRSALGCSGHQALGPPRRTVGRSPGPQRGDSPFQAALFWVSPQHAGSRPPSSRCQCPPTWSGERHSRRHVQPGHAMLCDSFHRVLCPVCRRTTPLGTSPAASGYSYREEQSANYLLTSFTQPAPPLQARPQ